MRSSVAGSNPACALRARSDAATRWHHSLDEAAAGCGGAGSGAISASTGATYYTEARRLFREEQAEREKMEMPKRKMRALISCHMEPAPGCDKTVTPLSAYVIAMETESGHRKIFPAATVNTP
jgi:hypothetical protein